MFQQLPYRVQHNRPMSIGSYFAAHGSSLSIASSFFDDNFGISPAISSEISSEIPDSLGNILANFIVHLFGRSFLFEINRVKLEIVFFLAISSGLLQYFTKFLFFILLCVTIIPQKNHSSNNLGDSPAFSLTIPLENRMRMSSNFFENISSNWF